MLLAKDKRMIQNDVLEALKVISDYLSSIHSCITIAETDADDHLKQSLANEFTNLRELANQISQEI